MLSSKLLKVLRGVLQGKRPAPRHLKKTCRLELETLEDRLVLSASLNSGTLTVAGLANVNNTISVNRILNSSTDEIQVIVNGSTQNFYTNSVSAVRIDGNGNADTINVSDLGAGIFEVVEPSDVSANVYVDSGFLNPLSTFRESLTIDGYGSRTAVVLDDANDSFSAQNPGAFTFGLAELSTPAGGSITSYYVNDVTFLGNADAVGLAGQFDVHPIIVQGFTTLTSGSLHILGRQDNLVTVQGFAGLSGPVTVRGVGQLNIDDSASTSANSYHLSGSEVDSSWRTINYSSVGVLTLTTGRSNDSVQVDSTSAPTTISTSGGRDTVNVGLNHSVQGIQGTLTVTNPPNYTALTVDDSADPTARTVTLSAGGIAGLAPAAINYNQFDLSSLSVQGGSGANVFTVSGTPNNPLTVTTTLNSGSGSNTVNVQATSGPLNVIGGGYDTVNVGLNHSVQGIQGTLTVTNPPNYTALTVDDSADPTARTVTLSAGGITGLAPAAINYSQPDLSSLSVQGGSGANVFTVTGTPNNPLVTTTLNSGRGSNTVNVQATSGPLNVIGGGYDTVNVGVNGSVQGIDGTVNVRNPPDHTTLNVNDSADATARTVTVSTGGITGLAPVAITFNEYDLAFLSIMGGSGDTFLRTGNLQCPVSLTSH